MEGYFGSIPVEERNGHELRAMVISYLSALRDEHFYNELIEISGDRWEVSQYVVPPGIETVEMVNLFAGLGFNDTSIYLEDYFCEASVLERKIAIYGDKSFHDLCKGVWEKISLQEPYTLKAGREIRTGFVTGEGRHSFTSDIFEVIYFVCGKYFKDADIKALPGNGERFTLVENKSGFLSLIRDDFLLLAAAHDGCSDSFVGYDCMGGRLIINGLEESAFNEAVILVEGLKERYK